MGGQIIVAALVVDTEEEARARAILAALAADAGVRTANVRWQLYPKLGPHSKISALAQLAAAGGQPLIDACEGFAALVVAPEALARAYLNSFIQDDGALFYNRIFDNRTSRFLRPDILWLDLEAHTHPDRQAQLAAHFA